jgi:thiamine-monophosphate kinase
VTEKAGRVTLGPGVEFDLIRTLTEGQGIPTPGVVLGPGDDCAILEGGLVVSVDLSVEGVHFRSDWLTLEEIGYRAMAAALSDLAAMAAEPLGVLLSMALPWSRAAESAPSRPGANARELQRGASLACEREGVQIIGGDLAGSPGPMALDVVALGRSDAPILRSGAEVGDEIWVTGWLGGSSAAVAHWNRGEDPPPALRERFARPTPRIREALWLANRVPLHALIDLSDGLAGDAGHLAAASGLAVVLQGASVPVHPAVGDHDPLHFAIEGGEDYELCLSVPPNSLDEWVAPFQDLFEIALTRVGSVSEGEGVFMEDENGRLKPLDRGGFSHFSVEEEG